ncbi:MAG: non-canonical purine NTP pyrophosphatase [Bacilli bacterium]
MSYLKSKNTRGDNGFGFNEIFELESGLTLAEITTKEKLEQSPRKKALDIVNKFVEKHNI